MFVLLISDLIVSRFGVRLPRSLAAVEVDRRRFHAELTARDCRFSGHGNFRVSRTIGESFRAGTLSESDGARYCVGPAFDRAGCGMTE